MGRWKRPKETGLIDPKEAEQALSILRSRDHQPTLVRLQDGSEEVVYNVASGRDLGNPYDHVTTNISPFRDDAEFSFWFTHQLIEIVDPETGRTLWQTLAS